MIKNINKALKQIENNNIKYIVVNLHLYALSLSDIIIYKIKTDFICCVRKDIIWIFKTKSNISKKF